MDVLFGPSVPPEINPGASLLLVGEAPGEHEISARRPFVGRSGKFLDSALARVGLRRKDFNIVNVVPWRPPGNKIDAFFAKGIPNEAVVEGVARLREHIRVYQPRAILALGNTALWALVGKRGIMDRRGSIYHYHHDHPDDAGILPAVHIPVLPTLHPAAVLREAQLANLFIRDLDRFRGVADGTTPATEPARELVLFPDADILQSAVQRILRAERLAVDIETGGCHL